MTCQQRNFGEQGTADYLGMNGSRIWWKLSRKNIGIENSEMVGVKP